MPINFNCPACGRIIAAEVGPGTQVRCPLCSQVVTVPPPGGAAPPVMPVQAGLSFAPTGEPPQQGMAIGALVCGILGLLACPLVGIVGLVLGIVALTRTNREPARYGGKGMAIGGIVTAAVSILTVPIVIVAVLPLLAQAREQAKRTVCVVNMRGIGQALFVYAQSNGMFPEAGADWQKRLLDAGMITPMQLRCPSDESGATCSYTYVPGFNVNSDPKQILLYEPPENHKGEGGNILYMDCSVRFVQSPEYEKAIHAIKSPNKTSGAPEKDKKKARTSGSRKDKEKAEKDDEEDDEEAQEEEEENESSWPAI